MVNFFSKSKWKGDSRELAIMDEQNRLNGAKKEGKADLLIKLLIKKFKILPDEYRKNRGYVRRGFRNRCGR